MSWRKASLGLLLLGLSSCTGPGLEPPGEADSTGGPPRRLDGGSEPVLEGAGTSGGQDSAPADAAGDGGMDDAGTENGDAASDSSQSDGSTK